MDIFSIRTAVSELFDNVVDSLPTELANIVEKQVYVAGGCFKSLILDEQPKDYDLWFRSAEARDSFKTLLALSLEEKTKPSPITNRDTILLEKLAHVTENAVTFKFPKATVQFILRETGSPKSLIEAFDFMHTQCFYDPISGEMSCPTAATIAKELIYNPSTPTPLSSLKRAFKLVKKGWSINDHNIEKLTQSLVGINWSNPEVRQAQAQGASSDVVPVSDENTEEERRPSRLTGGEVFSNPSYIIPRMSSDEFLRSTQASTEAIHFSSAILSEQPVEYEYRIPRNGTYHVDERIGYYSEGDIVRYQHHLPRSV